MCIRDRIKGGMVGNLVSGEEVDGHSLEGLRTEMPFHITIPVTFDTVERSRWSPDGPEKIATMETTRIEMSGVIDLVLCTRDIDGESTIRPVDLKTEGAENISEDEKTGLLESMQGGGSSPLSEAEERLLRSHRLQLALYYLALARSEEDKFDAGFPSRKVLSLIHISEPTRPY